MADKRKYVIPGDVITSGPFRPEQNVVLEGNNIIATSVGISEIYEDSVKVIPLTGKYIPKMLGVIEAPVTKMMKAYPSEFSFMRHQTKRDKK